MSATPPRLAIYLSPHLDDAVLSCGGRLWTDAARGRPARVITLCAGVPDYAALPPFAARLHRRWGDPPRLVELRRAEDLAALARLGVTDVVHLGVLDCIYRTGAGGRARYASDAAIFGRLDPEEDALAAALLAGELAGALPDASDCELFAPLGAGRHVDHQLAVAVARALAARGYRVAYYEDLPYAALAGEQVSGEHPLGGRALLECALEGKAGWAVETLGLDEAALAAKVDATSYYRTQVPGLYGDDLGMSRALRAYAAKVAPPGHAYGERVWRDGG